MKRKGRAEFEGKAENTTLCTIHKGQGTDHRSFWRSDAKTLRQDTGVVGGSRTVPQQLPVVQLLEGTEALALALPPNLEDLGVGGVDRGMGGAKIKHNGCKQCLMLSNEKLFGGDITQE